MFLRVMDVKCLGDHRLWVAFSDGRAGELPWHPMVWGPANEALRNPAFFAQARLDPEFGVVQWPNGYDTAPEYLYFLAFQDDLTLEPLFREWGYRIDDRTGLKPAV